MGESSYKKIDDDFLNYSGIEKLTKNIVEIIKAAKPEMLGIEIKKLTITYDPSSSSIFDVWYAIGVNFSGIDGCTNTGFIKIKVIVSLDDSVEEVATIDHLVTRPLVEFFVKCWMSSKKFRTYGAPVESIKNKLEYRAISYINDTYIGESRCMTSGSFHYFNFLLDKNLYREDIKKYKLEKVNYEINELMKKLVHISDLESIHKAMNDWSIKETIDKLY